MTDHTALQGVTRTVKLREHEFIAKPTMSGQDFGAITALANGSAEGDLFKVLSTAIRNTLIASEREKWDAIWKLDLDVPITWEETLAVANELCEEATGRPTQPLSLSGRSGENGQTRSTGASDFTAVPVSPISQSALD